MIRSLENHRRLLRQRAEQLTPLLQTIDKTIKRLFGFYSTAIIGYAGHVAPINSVRPLPRSFTPAGGSLARLRVVARGIAFAIAVRPRLRRFGSGAGWSVLEASIAATLVTTTMVWLRRPRPARPEFAFRHKTAVVKTG